MFFLAKDDLMKCKAFGTCSCRGDRQLIAEDMKFLIFDVYGVRLYAIFTSVEKVYSLLPYCQYTGTGVSIRLAKFLCHKISNFWPIDSITLDSNAPFLPDPAYVLTAPSHHEVELWVVQLLEHMPAPNAPGTSLSPVRPSTGERLPANLEPDDVYLFPTRSAAMYRLHQYLHKANGNEYKSVAFGPVFVSAFYILREWGAGCLEIVRNSDEDMQQLQEFCEIEISADRKVQAVYVEFPCHPNFECCDLYTLRRLADVYQFLLVVDASAGDICNIDLSSVADVFIFAPFHAMCGITVLDPLNRPTHQRLRKLFSENYRNEVFHLDAEALVRSTSNYRASLRRTEQPCKPCRNFFAKPGGKSIKYRVQGGLSPVQQDQPVLRDVHAWSMSRVHSWLWRSD